MPITMRVEPWPRRVLTRASGLVTHDELQAHLDEEERERATGDPELFDARGAWTDVTPDQLRALVRRAHVALHRGGVGPTAIVADDDLAFGMARMYQLLTELDGIAVGVFREIGGAERWLAAQAPPGTG